MIPEFFWFKDQKKKKKELNQALEKMSWKLESERA